VETNFNSILDYSYMNNTKIVFQIYVHNLLSYIYNILKWDPLPNDSSETAMLHGLILIIMGTNGRD